MWSIIRIHHVTVLLHKECECTAGMIKAALTKVLAKRKKSRPAASGDLFIMR